MLTRELHPQEYGLALELAQRVFNLFEAPDYSAEGIESFQRTIRDQAFVERIRFYGAFDGDQLVGLLATRNQGAHIALFFVDEAYHRCGIGRSLFALALTNTDSTTITVHSSPYAVAVYQRLGFAATMPEQVRDGIRYTPMVLDRR